MTVFLAEQRQKTSSDTRGSLVLFASTKIKRTTLRTTASEVYALMKCFGACQMLRSLWKDISGSDACIHMSTDTTHLVRTASTTHVPEQQETIHMFRCTGKKLAQVLLLICRMSALSVVSADCLTKTSANCKNRVDSVMGGDIKEIDSSCLQVSHRAQDFCICFG